MELTFPGIAELLTTAGYTHSPSGYQANDVSSYHDYNNYNDCSAYCSITVYCGFDFDFDFSDPIVAVRVVALPLLLPVSEVSQLPLRLLLSL